jgi:kanosamine 6-kinase
VITCIEAGGSGAQTVVFAGEGAPSIVAGVHAAPGATLLLAVPGILHDGVVTASNLGWYGADPAAELGCADPAALVMNDAEAAALGESVLRDGADLVFLGVGTGVGGAVVVEGQVVGENLFGHAKGFSIRECPCGGIGCLETVAAGWALPDPLPAADIPEVAVALARAVDAEPLATPATVVVAGGLARRHPALVSHVAARLPDRVVEASRAPQLAKSAAAWGLAHVALEAGIVRR